MSMNQAVKNKLPWFICALLVGLVMFLFFKLIDQSMTLDHQMQYASTVIKQRNILAKILNASGSQTPEGRMRQLLKTYSVDPVFDKSNGEIVADQVSVFVQNGHFLRVDVDNL